ncbi:MAG TPA: hypothetical protein VM347_10000 [Nonomuraea sp.]|nr:hypothetical protein [Nonomuraea sp.]
MRDRIQKIAAELVERNPRVADVRQPAKAISRPRTMPSPPLVAYGGTRQAWLLARCRASPARHS